MSNCEVMVEDNKLLIALIFVALVVVVLVLRSRGQHRPPQVARTATSDPLPYIDGLFTILAKRAVTSVTLATDRSPN